MTAAGVQNQVAPTVYTAADVAVVICTYNSGADIGPCLETVKAAGPGEVVVVDNGSDDDSVAIATRAGATVIHSGGNVGYASAANIGASATSAPIILILNPDCEVREDAFAVLAATFSDAPAIGVLGPRIEHPDGSLQRSCRTFPDVMTAAAHGFIGLVWDTNPLTRRYTMADWDHASPRVVDWVSGAALAVRREVFEAVGGFDPGYWMYVEDVDLCWRVWQAGWAVAYEPAAVMTHIIGTSSGRAPYKLLAAHHRSMLRFELVRRGGRKGVTWPIVVAGVGVRFAAAAAHKALGQRQGGHQ